MADAAVENEQIVDADDHHHAALFAHVGITDPADWRSVALRLAERYAPDLLTDAGPSKPSVTKNVGGRREEWSDGRLWLLVTFIDMVREGSRDGRLRPGLVKNRDVCKFIAGPYHETQWMRDALQLQPGIDFQTLENMRRIAIKREEKAAAHGNG